MRRTRSVPADVFCNGLVGYNDRMMSNSRIPSDPSVTGVAGSLSGPQAECRPAGAVGAVAGSLDGVPAAEGGRPAGAVGAVAGSLDGVPQAPSGSGAGGGAFRNGGAAPPVPGSQARVVSGSGGRVRRPVRVVMTTPGGARVTLSGDPARKVLLAERAAAAERFRLSAGRAAVTERYRFGC